VYVSNRDLVVMATAAFVVAACAVLMTVNAVPDRVREEHAPTDVVAVVPNVAREGGAPIDPQGPLTVRAIGTPPDSVLLTCDMFKAQRGFEGHLAWFSSLPVGDCALSFGNARPWSPVYPGDSLACQVRDGSTECTGGLATSRAGRVSVTSATPADLYVDGALVGPLPARDLALRVGTRALRLAYADGRSARYALIIEPDQRIRVTFPSPSGMAAAPPPPVEPPRARPTEPTAIPPIADEDTGPEGR